MKYNFDKAVERKNTKSVKYDLVEEKYGDKDVIPMWVADMDFEVPDAVKNAIIKRAEHGIYGYTIQGEDYNKAVISWMKRRHNWNINNEWIKFSPGVVPALNLIVKTYTKPGDEVIVQTPVYYPFYSAVINSGCRVIKNPLTFKDDKYTMDFEDLKNKITKRTRLLILCNPHNPVGRVWTKEELTTLGNICLENNIIVVSDEIHFDIIHKRYKHTVFASINEEFSQNSITCTAPSKTFNLAGLKTSNIIIPNKKLRNLFEIAMENNSIQGPNIFGIEALIAAYNDGEEWLDELIDYLDENFKYLNDYFKNKIPQIKVIKPEGTYLVWIDCSKLGMNAEQLKDFFVKKAKLGFDDGIMFGEEGAEFQRINIACSRDTLKEALKRIEDAVKELK